MIRCFRPGITLLAVGAGAACAGSEVTVPPTPVGEVRESIPLQYRPYGLAVAGSSAFVTQLDAATVTRVELSEPASVRSPVTVGSIPTGVAVTRDGGQMLVANQGDASVALIDVATGSQTVFRTQGSPFRVIVSGDGRRGYATTSVGEIVSIDLIAHRVLGTLSTGKPANGLALGPDGNRLYVSSTSGGIAVVDLASFTIASELNVPGQLQEVVVAPDGSELYVADEGGRLVIVRLAGFGVTSVQMPGAFGMALSLDATQLWITQPYVGTITMVDRVTHAVIKTITVGTGVGTVGFGVPRRIAFTSGGLAVVTDEGGKVHVIR
ncbi:MAG: hypothetical protein ACJ8AD_11420 [Gemmatimonadaceae bacterium]